MPNDNFERNVDLGRFSRDPDKSGYNYGVPYATGNESLDKLFGMLIGMIGGQNLAPRGVPGRSIYDSYLNRDRSRDFMKIMQSGFGDTPMMQMFGRPDKDSMTYKVAAGFLGNPDNPLAKFLSPFQGGNPVAAQMNLYARMHGMSMDAFGTRGNLQVGESSQMMQTMYDTFYNRRKITDQDVQDVQSRMGTKRYDAAMSTESSRAVFQDINEQRIGGQINDKDVYSRYAQAIRDRLKSLDDNIVQASAMGQKEVVSKLTEEYKKTKRELEPALKSVEEANKAITDIEKLRDEGYSMPRDVRYNKTRGFDVQEFSRAYTTALDFKLVDGRKSGVQGSFKDFLDNGGGFMDAARSVFGTTNGTDAMEAINDFVGKGFVDVSKAGDANKLEDVLRKVKGAAKLAGVSMDAILGVIKEGQNLASAHPQLQYLGGMEVADMATKALQTTSAMAATYGAKFVRRNGGEAGMTQAGVQQQLQDTQEPIAQRFYAANYMLEQMKTGASKEKQALIEAQQKRLSDASSNPLYTNENAVSQLMLDVAGKVGTNTYGFMQNTYNEMFAREGVDLNPELGRNASRNTIAQLATRFIEGSGTNVSDVTKWMGENGASFKEAMAHFNLSSPQLQKIYQYAPMAVEEMMAKQTPTYQRHMAVRESQLKQYGETDKMVSEKMAKFNAPLFQNLAQSFLSGGISRNGLKEIEDLIKDPEDQRGYGNLMQSIKDFSDDKSDANASRLFQQAYGNTALSDKNNVAALTSILGKVGIEDLQAFGNDQSAFNEAQRNNSKLSGVDFKEVQKAYAAAQAAGYFSDDMRKRLGNGTHTADEMHSLYAEAGLSKVTEAARRAVLGDVAKETSSDILGAVDAEGSLSGKSQKEKDAYWGARSEIDSRYTQWDGKKRVGFNIEQYRKDLEAGSVSAATQAIVNPYMERYNELAKPLDEAEAQWKKDLGAGKGPDMQKQMQDFMSTLGTQFDSVRGAIEKLSGVLGAATGVAA